MRVQEVPWSPSLDSSNIRMLKNSNCSPFLVCDRETRSGFVITIFRYSEGGGGACGGLCGDPHPPQWPALQAVSTNPSFHSWQRHNPDNHTPPLLLPCKPVSHCTEHVASALLYTLTKELASLNSIGWSSGYKCVGLCCKLMYLCITCLKKGKYFVLLPRGAHFGNIMVWVITNADFFVPLISHLKEI